MHLDGNLIVSAGQSSTAGAKPHNEDSVGIRIPECHQLTTKGVVAVVADGVSAAEGGREASETCVTGFLADYFSTPETWSVKQSVQQVLTALNRWLYGQGQHFLQAEKGYVSTFSAVIFKSRVAHVFHVGDSRIWRLRQNQIEQLTRDHVTGIGEGKNYLTRAMGLDVRLDVDYRKLDMAVGDTFLLTTDGVHEFLSLETLALAMSDTESDCQWICERLIEQACEAGSDDNLSCQLLRVEALPLESVDDVQARLTELPFPPPLEQGMLIDGYRVLAEVHASRRSQLYHVRDEQDGKDYALKAPSPNYEDDPAYIERFILESWIGARIDNPHVLKVIEPPRPRTFQYHLSSFIEGQTLSEWASANPGASVQRRLGLVRQLIQGLSALHRRETWHQDLKPDNVLIDDEGHLCIVDLGACRVGGLSEISSPISHEGVLGTADYAAPEYKQGGAGSAAADQYSLGVIVFELLTGRLPFEGRGAAADTVASHSRLRYIPCWEYNPHVPVWMDGAVRKALSTSAEARFTDVQEFLYALEHPQEEFSHGLPKPLAQRNPLRFWKTVAGILFVGQLFLLWYFLKP